MKRPYRVRTSSADIAGVMLTDEEFELNSKVEGWSGQLEINEPVMLHKPPPAFSTEPREIPADPPPWRVCPSCGAENTEHKPKCPRANWNVNKYTLPRQPEADRGYRIRLIDNVNRMNDLDRYAVATVTGDGLDEIGRHLKMPRR